MKFDDLYHEIVVENRLATLAAAGLLAMSPMQDVVAKSSPSIERAEKSDQPRGFRNNNPGNIEKGKDAWNGAIGNDGRFIIFKDMTHGVRAIARILRNYQNDHGINTIRGVITRWAPPKENPTEKYIRFVVGKMESVDSAEQVIDLNDRNILYELIPAIIRFENGASLDESDIVAGITAERS